MGSLHWYASVDCQFKEPIPPFDDIPRVFSIKDTIRYWLGFRRQMKGLGRCFCVTASCEKEAKRLIESEILSDPFHRRHVSRISYDTFELISNEQARQTYFEDPEMEDALCGQLDKNGIWYQSGRAFYW